MVRRWRLGNLFCDNSERVGIETLSRWLLAAGLWHGGRRDSDHPQRRERRAHWVNWFRWKVRNTIGLKAPSSSVADGDDATNWTHARFFPGETTAAAVTIFQEYVGYDRRPRALQVDRDSIYKTMRDSKVDEALRNTSPLTQFGRAMKSLGVDVILARSPQAKVRVERRQGVFQDRLVKGIRLKGISGLEAANVYLAEVFLDNMNTRFHVEARTRKDVHRNVPGGTKPEHVLCYEESRVVQIDWTVSWCNRILQLDKRHQKLVLAQKRTLVSELLDGTFRQTYRVTELSWRELPPKLVAALANTKASHHPTLPTSLRQNVRGDVAIDQYDFARRGAWAPPRFACVHFLCAQPPRQKRTFP